MNNGRCQRGVRKIPSAIAAPFVAAQRGTKNVDFSNWMADVSAPLPAMGSTPVTSKTTGTDRPASPCATAKGRRRLTDIDATAAGPALTGFAKTSKPSMPDAATR